MRGVRRHVEHILGQMLDPAEQAASPREKDAGARVVNEILLVDLSFQKFERFAHAEMNDRVQRFALDLLAREAGVVLEQNRFARQTIAQRATAFFDFQFLCARHRNAQSHRDVVRDVIAADREHAALFHRTIDIQNEIGRAAADIDHERAEIFLLLRQHHLRGRERGENNVLHIKRQFFYASNRVLNPRPDTVDDVKIRFQPMPEHADGIEHSFLSIDVIILARADSLHAR